MDLCQEPNPLHAQGSVFPAVPQADKFLFILLSRLIILPFPKHSGQSLAGHLARSLFQAAVSSFFFPLDSAQQFFSLLKEIGSWQGKVSEEAKSAWSPALTSFLMTPTARISAVAPQWLLLGLQ